MEEAGGHSSTFASFPALFQSFPSLHFLSTLDLMCCRKICVYIRVKKKAALMGSGQRPNSLFTAADGDGKRLFRRRCASISQASIFHCMDGSFLKGSACLCYFVLKGSQKYKIVEVMCTQFPVKWRIVVLVGESRLS